MLKRKCSCYIRKSFEFSQQVRSKNCCKNKSVRERKRIKHFLSNQCQFSKKRDSLNRCRYFDVRCYSPLEVLVYWCLVTQLTDKRRVRSNNNFGNTLMRLNRRNDDTYWVSCAVNP